MKYAFMNQFCHALRECWLINYNSRKSLRVVDIHLIRIMKLTFLLFMVAFMQVQASVYSQTVRLDERGTGLEKVFTEIRKQTGYNFLYNNRLLKNTLPVTLKVTGSSLISVLDEIFENQPLTYSIIDKTIVIKKKESIPGKKSEAHVEKLLNNVLLVATNKETRITTPNRLENAIRTLIDISGRVVDEKGDPLPGVSVLLKGTQRGTTTDLQGKFVISVSENDVQTTGGILILSYVGYLAQEVALNNQSSLEVVLLADTKVLNEVVVVGYGTQQREDITGAISTVSSKELRDAPVAQVAQMLQGKLSGVRIDQTSGRPGEGMNIKIRGAVSITAGANPLYVVDGMPISGDINTINPAEIESISVLKDAASASLYGSRAGNGVVLIQTKSAVAGKTRIDFSAYAGVGKVPDSRKLNMMNAEQYAQFQKEVAELNGRVVNPAFTNPSEYAGKGTDWFDAVTRTSSVQSYNLSVTSGSKNFSTAVTGGYFKENGVVVGTGFQRLSLRVNSVFTPNDKVRIGFNVAPNYAFNTNFATDGGPYGTENIVSSALATTPLANPYNADGTLALTASDPATFGNPNWLRVAKEKVFENKNLQLLSNAYAEYKIMKGLTAKTTAGVQLSNSNVFQFNPSTIGVLFTPPPRIPSGSDNTARMYNWVNENSLVYQNKFGEHNFDALINFTAQQYRRDATVVNASNFADDKIQAVSAAGRQVVTSDIQEWAVLSYLGRINYNYKNKYLVTASIRRDGSSRFGPNNRWGNFPSASVGWIVSKENFWNVKPISFFKLRASYGITGNFEIGNYTFRSTVGPVFYGFNNGLFQGRAANNLGDSNLGWERKKQMNIGADVYLIDDRIQLSYNFYSTRSSDLLFNVDVPRSSGFSSIQTNIGELKLWGHEIGIMTHNVRSDRFSWNTNFNLSVDRNKVLKLSTEKSNALYHGMINYGFSSHISQVGKPVGMFYGAVQEGVYKDQADFDSSPKYSDSQVGTIKFKDLNGDGKISFPEDYTTIGNPWPDFIFGMTNQINYRNFDLGITVTGSKGNDILAHHENWTTNLDGPFNVLEEVKDRWKSPEDPGAGKYGSVQQGTTYLERDRWHTRFIKDGSFVSIKNITVGYTIPVNKNAIRNLRVYTSIQNAFVFTKYTGPNPEVNTKTSSSGSSPGVDENSYPVPRVVSLGVNLGF
jgi:TonB-linked SusC/RagA family outer membrane protein